MTDPSLDGRWFVLLSSPSASKFLADALAPFQIFYILGSITTAFGFILYFFLADVRPLSFNLPYYKLNRDLSSIPLNIFRDLPTPAGSLLETEPLPLPELPPT
jgi:hypothetical protein